MKRLENNIQKVRKARAISGPDFCEKVARFIVKGFGLTADEARLTATELSLIESGKVCPTPQQLTAFCAILGKIEASELYGSAAVAFISGASEPGSKGKRPKLAGAKAHEGEQQLRFWIADELLARLDRGLTAQIYKSRAEWFLACCRAVAFGPGQLLTLRPVADFGPDGESELIILSGDREQDEIAAIEGVRRLHGFMNGSLVGSEGPRPDDRLVMTVGFDRKYAAGLQYGEPIGGQGMKQPESCLAPEQGLRPT